MITLNEFAEQFLVPLQQRLIRQAAEEDLSAIYDDAEFTHYEFAVGPPKAIDWEAGWRATARKLESGELAKEVENDE